MDEKPFYSLDLANLKEEDFIFLSGISRDKFNSMQLIYRSQDIKYRNAILENLKRELCNPSKGFVSFITSNFYKGKLHESIYNRFRVIIKDCINLLVTDNFFEDIMELKEGGNLTEEPCNYTEEELKIIEIIKDWLTKYETEDAHLYISKLSDGFIRVCMSSEWWNICRIKYRPYWDYKISVKICKEALAAKSETMEIKSIEELHNLRSQIEAQCQDTKSRLFAYRAEHEK